jgi:hypothetical protein
VEVSISKWQQLLRLGIYGMTALPLLSPLEEQKLKDGVVNLMLFDFKGAQKFTRVRALGVNPDYLS